MNAIVSEIFSGALTLSAIILALTILVMGAKVFLQPGHAVSIAVNDSKIVTASAGQTLFNALGDADYRLPGTCGGKGTCGLCRVAVLDGAGAVLPAEHAKLSRKEIRNRVRLACQVVLRQDLSVELPASMLNTVSVVGQVETVRHLAPLIRELVVALPPNSGLEPEAGAFVEIDVPAYELSFADIAIADRFKDYWSRLGLTQLKAANRLPLTRAYSVANRPQDRDRIVLNIRLALPPPNRDAPPGVGSSYLFGLASGDAVHLRGPFGNFRVQETDREKIFIGGGVGMAPLRAMIFDELERKGAQRKISYWYGARSRFDLFYDEEFDDLAARHSNFRWTVALSEPAPGDDWRGATGFIHMVVRQAYLDSHPAPEECEYYLCGPPMMIRSVRLMLQDLGVDSENIFFDDFGS